MEYNEIIKKSNKVKLEEFDKEKNEINEDICYFSKIVEFVDKENILIDVPKEKNKKISLTLNKEYFAVFYTRQGLFECNVVIEKTEKEGKVEVYQIKIVSPLEKKQRRQFYRLDYVMNIEFKKVGIEEDKWEEGVLSDISGGGMCFNSEYLLDESSDIEVKFSVKIKDKVYDYKCVSKLIMLDKLPNNEDRYEYRIAFSDLSFDDQENIVRFIFEEERKQRRTLKNKENNN